MPGTGFAIGGINPLLKSPKSNIWSATVERRLGNNFAASVGYSGSHSYNIVDNGNANGIVSYGVDINNFAGDLIHEREQGSDPAQSQLRCDHLQRQHPLCQLQRCVF